MLFIKRTLVIDPESRADSEELANCKFIKRKGFDELVKDDLIISLETFRKFNDKGVLQLCMLDYFGKKILN